MKTWWAVSVFLVATSHLSADPREGTQWHVESGTLESGEAWWELGPETQARCWYQPSAGGSAWLRIGDWQLGPLVSMTSTAGVRSWRRGAFLSSGRWGVAWDGHPVGAWAVQTPDTFEAGGQFRLEFGDWTASASADRTWSTAWEVPAEGGWSDRYRLGGGWRWREGEVCSSVLAWVPAAGGATLTPMAKIGLEKDDARFRAAWTAPTQTELEADWLGYTLAAKFSQSLSQGRYSAGWSSHWLGLLGWWVIRDGPGARTWTAAEWGRYLGRLAVQMEQRSGGWKEVYEVQAGWVGNQGKGELAWALEVGDALPIQSVSAVWTQLGWKFRARWITKGLRWGWIGPDQRFELWLTLGSDDAESDPQSPT